MGREGTNSTQLGLLGLRVGKPCSGLITKGMCLMLQNALDCCPEFSFRFSFPNSFNSSHYPASIKC